MDLLYFFGNAVCSLIANLFPQISKLLCFKFVKWVWQHFIHSHSSPRFAFNYFVWWAVKEREVVLPELSILTLLHFLCLYFRPGENWTATKSWKWRHLQTGLWDHWPVLLFRWCKCVIALQSAFVIIYTYDMVQDEGKSSKACSVTLVWFCSEEWALIWTCCVFCHSSCWSV